MQAETAYNVIQALPETEKARLYAMLNAEMKSIAKPAKKSNVWTVEECTEIVLKIMNDRKKKRLRANMKVVK